MLRTRIKCQNNQEHDQLSHPYESAHCKTHMKRSEQEDLVEAEDLEAAVPLAIAEVTEAVVEVVILPWSSCGYNDQTTVGHMISVIYCQLQKASLNRCQERCTVCLVSL